MFLLTALSALGGPAAPSETVVLLHGLGRGPLSMVRLAHDLRAAGYEVRNLAYPSRRGDLRSLAKTTLGPVFADAPAGARVHIVTHSMGALLVRQYLHDHGAPVALGRVVMLAPPNQGSELVDRFQNWRLYRAMNGPAGVQLGTASTSAPRRLGAPPADVRIGVIAGDRSQNPLFSALIPGPDDGKVGVARTHLANEADHVTLPMSHTWIMWRRPALDAVRAFLRDGRFSRSPAS